MKTFFSICSLLLFALCHQHAAAKSADETSAVIEAAIDAGFSEVERQIIDEYYRDTDSNKDSKAKKNKSKESKKMPPGLAKKDSLPPGLARQLEKNGTLPPGLAKRELPTDLNKKLPKRKDTLERIIVDTSVVLAEKATGRIIDIIKDVVTKN